MPNNPISPRKPCSNNYVWRDLQKFSSKPLFYCHLKILFKTIEIYQQHSSVVTDSKTFANYPLEMLDAL